MLVFNEYWWFWERHEGAGRLNGVVSLVTVFEQLSHVTSPFWSCDKVNWGIHLFEEQDLRTADLVICSSAVSKWCLSPLSSRLEKIKWFLSFCCMGLYSCSLNTLWLFYGMGKELSSLLVLCTIKYHIISIDLLDSYGIFCVRLLSLG